MFRLTAQLAVILALLCLAVANIYVRATWSELEDGVLWNRTPEGVIAATEVAEGSPGARAGLREGDVLEAIDGRPIETVDDVDRQTSCGVERQGAELHGRPADGAPVARHPPDQARADPVGRARALLRARRRRDLFAVRRRGGPVPAARQPGHAALLLADDRVLRDARVFVLGAVRHARLGVLLGGRRLDAAPAAAVRALRAGVPGASRQLGAQRLGPDAAAAVSPRAAARRRARGGDAADGRSPRGPVEPAHAGGARRAAVPERRAHRGPGDHDSRARARAVRDGAPAAALDRLGHGARRGPVRALVCAAVRPRVQRAARLRADGGAPRVRAAGLRLGDRPLSADGRRGDHQARAGLRGRARGHRGDVRGAPEAGAARCSCATGTRSTTR